MRLITSWLLVLALVSFGCHESPAINGVSLECKDDAACAPLNGDLGQGWRCYKSVCIKNSPPVLSRLDRVYLLPGVEQQIVASATDPEGDPITYTWITPEDTASTTWGRDGAILRVTTTGDQYVTYELSVDAFDGYETSSTPVSVVGKPTADAVYVSLAGTNDDSLSCGSYDAPCHSVARGLEVLRATGAQHVRLAAMTGATAYRECLRLEGNDIVLGCYDPQTWVAQPSLRERCRIECTSSAGHVLQGSAHLSEVVLAMNLDPGVRDPADTGPGTHPDGTPLPYVTAWIPKDAAPVLENVDIETPPCAGGCRAVGLASVDASPQLIGVNVFGVVDDFQPIESFVGLLMLGGAPSVQAAAGRGEVLLNAPAISYATGILAAKSDLSVDGIEVNGGPASSLNGILTLDGNPVLESNRVTLSGFGTTGVAGISLDRCAKDTIHACDCAYWQSGCATFGSVQPASAAKATGNEISLSGSSDQVGLVPCAGIGLYADTTAVALEARSNTVTIGRNFTLGVGLLAEADRTSSEFTNSLGHQLTDNSVTIADARVDWLCVQLNQNGKSADFPSGAVGALIRNTAGVAFRRGSVQVGGHETGSFGLVVSDNEKTELSANLVEVGDDLSPIPSRVWTPGAYGALLTGNRTSDVSIFRRNEVRVSDLELDGGQPVGGAISAVALTMSIADATDGVRYPQWQIENNFLFGGRVPYSVGLLLSAATEDAAWPALIHNTIFAGGDAAIGLVSTAVGLAVGDTAFVTAKTGLLKNNLVDAGDALGRKYLLYNKQPTAPLFNTTAADTNVAQVSVAGTGPQPTLAAPVDLASVIENLGAATELWHVLLANSGEVTTLRENAAKGVLQEGASAATLGRPGAAWFGVADVQEFIVIAVPQAISVAHARTDGSMEDFVRYPIVNPASGASPPVPRALAMADVDGTGPADILFLASASCDGKEPAKPSLCFMPGKTRPAGGGYGHAETMDTSTITMTDPAVLEVSDTKGNPFAYVGDGTKLHEIGLRKGTATTTDLSAVGVTGPITALRVKNFITEALDPQHDEIVIIAGGKLYAWVNGAAWNSPAAFDTPPCNGLDAAALDVGDAFPLAGYDGAELVAGCWKGASANVEVHHYYAAPIKKFYKIVEYTTGEVPVTGVAVGSPDIANKKGKVLVTRSDPPQILNQVVVLTVDAAGPSISTTALLDFLPDALSFDPVNMRWRDLSGTIDGVTILNPSSPSLCPLELHRVGGNPFDLHLATDPDGNSCVDGGDPLVGIADDFDGCNARSAPPDIGADEFGSTGQACNY